MLVQAQTTQTLHPYATFGGQLANLGYYDRAHWNLPVFAVPDGWVVETPVWLPSYFVRFPWLITTHSTTIIARTPREPPTIAIISPKAMVSPPVG